MRFLAEHPGASNRQVAVAAGHADEAQISRLLHRMRELGFARCETLGPGQANAWRLTHQGRREAEQAQVARPNAS